MDTITQEQWDNFDRSAVTVGQTVHHEVYGIGKVIRALNVSRNVIVRFESDPQYGISVPSNSLTIVIEEPVKTVLEPVKEPIPIFQMSSREHPLGEPIDIAPSSINIPVYQTKGLRMDRVESMVRAGFKPELLGTLSVNQRNGKYYVFAGRHRVHAIRRWIEAGVLPNDYRVPCRVFYLNEVEEKIAFRDAVERKRTHQETWDNNLLVNDPVYKRVRLIIEKYHFSIASEADPNVLTCRKVSCLKELVDMYKGVDLRARDYVGPLGMDNGQYLLACTLSVLNAAYPVSIKRGFKGHIVNEHIVEALSYIVRELGTVEMGEVVDLNLLAKVVSSLCPHEWLDAAKRSAYRGENLGRVMALLMIYGTEYKPNVSLPTWYNRHQRSGHKRIEIGVLK